MSPTTGGLGRPILLQTTKMTKRFGGLSAVKDIDFKIHEKEILGLIGPNGAGKSTFFNLVTGIYQPTSGDVRWKGASILGQKPHAITKLGLARTFQNIRLFANMTALENVAVGRHIRTKVGVLGAVLRSPAFQAEEAAIFKRAGELLALVGLTHREQDLAKNLPYGEQRRLEIARALATDPELLLLDEPAAGMNPQETVELTGLIGRLRDLGYTVLLIEHDMKLVMSICERVIVMCFGEKIADGTPAQVQADPKVIGAYLGSDEEATPA